MSQNQSPESQSGVIRRNKGKAAIAAGTALTAASVLWLHGQTEYPVDATTDVDTVQADIPDRVFSPQGLKVRLARALHGDFDDFLQTRSLRDVIDGEASRRGYVVDTDAAIKLPENAQLAPYADDSLPAGTHAIELGDPTTMAVGEGVILIQSELPENIGEMMDGDPQIAGAVAAYNAVPWSESNATQLPLEGMYPADDQLASRIINVTGGPVTNEAVIRIGNQLEVLGLADSAN